MAIMARKPQSSFTPPPEGLYQAVCVDVWDVYTVENTFKHGQMVDKTRIVWALELSREDGKPFEVSYIYTLSLHEKSNLRKHLEAWRGKKFTKDELNGFDLEKLIGANCQIQVVHNVKDGGETYANVQAIVPIGKGMTKLSVPDGYVRHRDRDQNQNTGGAEAPAGDADAGDAEVAF